MITLENFYQFVSEINLENGRNYKLEVLKKYKDNENVKYYLNYVFNPYIVTGISTKKLNKKVSVKASFDLFSEDTFTESLNVKDVLEYIKEHNTGRDADLVVVQNLKRNLNTELNNLFDQIITKSLSIGVNVKSINEIMNDLIPTFNVQLANKYFQKPEIVEGKVFALTTKIDGGRIIALKENGKVSFYTRAGQPYEGLVDLEQEMLDKLPDNICLDGEITLLDKGDLTSKEQYQQTMKITRKDGVKHGVKMLVFDCMTAEEFRNQKCDTPYLTRRNNMLNKFCELLPGVAISISVATGTSPKDYYNNIIQLLNDNYTYFQILPYLYIGDDSDEIISWLNYNINQGEEGVMINMIDAPYSFDRTNDLLKVKKMNDVDLEIVGYEEGDKQYAGMLGAFVVRYKDGNTVKVGSGIKKKLRQEAWKNPDSYIGKIISVQFFEETQNQNGGSSLRFPVFLDFRPDKLTPDY